MIVHGIWASSVMVGDAGGEGVKPSVNFHGDRCGAVWCNGLDWRKRSIPTHSGWLYPLTFDAEKGLKEA